MKSVRFDIHMLVNLSPLIQVPWIRASQGGIGISLSKVRKVVPAHTYMLHPDRVLQVPPQLISCLLQGQETNLFTNPSQAWVAAPSQKLIAKPKALLLLAR